MPERHLLVRTTTEKFDYDDAKLRERFASEYVAWKENWTERHFPPIEDEQKQWEWFVIDLFEKIDGSLFGDNWFGQVDADSGIELFIVSEDD